MRNYLLVLGLILCSINAFADHIIGGQMNYVCLGNNEYTVTVKLFLDSDQLAGPDDFAVFNVFDASGTFVKSIDVPSANINIVKDSVLFEDACDATNNFKIVTYSCTYEANITIDDPSVGHTISYGRCCLPASLVNIENDPNGWSGPAGKEGITVTSFIPASADASCNNSPQFSSNPPNFICITEENTFEFAATDADGDDLTYHLAPVFTGMETGYYMQTSAEAVEDYPPFESVDYNAGYTGTSPFGADFSVDETTGRITGTPTATGNYMIGVEVRESRNGVYLGSTYRFVMINVRACDIVSFDVLPSGNATYETRGCLSYDFLNHSIGGNQWYWDFGVEGTEDDKSTEKNPTFRYDEAGVYDVTLIVENTDRDCFDTTVTRLKVDVDRSVDFDIAYNSADRCLGDGVTFTDKSIWPIPVSNQTRTWIFGDKKDTVINDANSVEHHYVKGGIYKVGVQLDTEECGFGQKYQSVFIPDSPLAGFELAKDTADASEPVVITNTSEASTYVTWEFGDGTTAVVNDSLVYHNYTESGEFYITQKVSNPDQSVCSDSLTKMIKLTYSVLDFPTAFTPNNDDINDHFSFLIGGMKDISLTIYNRWNEVVYESTSVTDEPWDGTHFKNGKALPSGTYTYFFTATNEDFNEQIPPVRGYVNLIR